MRFILSNTQGDAMRWILDFEMHRAMRCDGSSKTHGAMRCDGNCQSKTHGAMRCDLICNFPAWPAWPESCSFLWLRLKTYAFQNPRGDAMRFLCTRDDTMRFRMANHTGRCDAIEFFKRHDAMRYDRFWKLEDTGRCDAMDVRNLKARGDAMR